MNATAIENVIEQKTQAGERVATVGRYGTKMAATGSGYSDPIWTGKIYVAKPRKSDGVLTWRLDSYFGDTRSGRGPSVRFTSELESQTKLDWYDYEDGIRQGTVCK